MSTYSDQIAQVSVALSDPTRREIMEHVFSSQSPLSVREVAEHFNLHANAARMHLDKLVKGGLLKVVRRRGARGGRPAHLYRAADLDWDLHIPPRSYRLLAEILAQAICDLIEPVPEGVKKQALRSGREEALRNSSPLAYLPPDAGIEEVVRAWLEDIERRGIKTVLKSLDGGKAVVIFASCPFGELSTRHPHLVCEIHRTLEEGVLSLVGGWCLHLQEERGCAFILEACG